MRAREIFIWQGCILTQLLEFTMYHPHQKHSILEVFQELFAGCVAMLIECGWLLFDQYEANVNIIVLLVIFVLCGFSTFVLACLGGKTS